MRFIHALFKIFVGIHGMELLKPIYIIVDYVLLVCVYCAQTYVRVTHGPKQS